MKALDLGMVEMDKPLGFYALYLAHLSSEIGSTLDDYGFFEENNGRQQLELMFRRYDTLT